MRLLFCILPLLFAGMGVAWAASATGASSAEKAAPSEEADGDADAESEAADDPGFERYKTIMDRMPFGREPSGFNPDAPPGTAPAGGGRGGADAVAEEAARTEEERRILSAVRVSAINVTPSGKIAVGFTDSTAQPAVNYYLKVGESRDGWLVKDADADELKATLAKGDVEVELGLGEGQDGGKGAKGSKGAKGGRPAGVPPLPAAGRGLLSHRPPVAGRPQAASADGRGALSVLKSRRAEKERLAAEEAARKAAADAVAKQEAAEKEAEAAREREQTAADREQLRVMLQQTQEVLQKQREKREAAEKAAQEEEDSSDGEGE